LIAFAVNSIAQSHKKQQPYAVVAADRMNILYAGVDNPISVAVPGVSPDKVSASVSNGSLTGSKGHYNLRVTSPGMVYISVSAKTDKGEIKQMGTAVFSVKPIPDPKAEFAGKHGGIVDCVELKAQDMLFARLDNFGIDAKFIVTKFTFYLVKPHQEAVINSTEGAELNAEMKAALATITPGTLLIFKDIVVAFPDRVQRQIEPIIFTAN